MLIKVIYTEQTYLLLTTHFKEIIMKKYLISLISVLTLTLFFCNAPAKALMCEYQDRFEISPDSVSGSQIIGEPQVTGKGYLVRSDSHCFEMHDLYTRDNCPLPLFDKPAVASFTVGIDANHKCDMILHDQPWIPSPVIEYRHCVGNYTLLLDFDHSSHGTAKYFLRFLPYRS